MSKSRNAETAETVKVTIHEWCEAVLAQSGNSTASIDELADHLYCEIERLMAEGLSATDAFTVATEQMGDSNLLRTEFAKNRNIFTKLVCAIQAFETNNFTEDITPAIGPKKMLVITVANLILLAIVTFSIERVLDGTYLFAEVSVLLYLLWFGSFMIFYSATLPSSANEIACLRRRVVGFLKRG